jgi:hypothetical protein
MVPCIIYLGTSQLHVPTALPPEKEVLGTSGIALGYGLDDREFESWQRLGIFPSPPRPERLWGPPNLSKWYQGFYPWG